MIITLTGKLGSGKSEICRILKEKHNFEIYSTGNIHRQIAAEKKLSTIEFNKLLAKKNNGIDFLIDSKTKLIADEAKKNNINIAIDSRLAWHFVPYSFKVYLTVDNLEAGRRVFLSRTSDVEKYKSIEEASILLQKRKKLEDLRFKEIYHVDCSDLKNFDLILDTTSISPQEAVTKIINSASIK